MATKTVYILTGGSNNHPTASFELTKIFTHFITEGIIGSIGRNVGSGGTGAFAVNAIGTPNMSVRVDAGEAIIEATPTGSVAQKFPVKMAATEDVVIAANSSGATRYDWIYLKLDADKLTNPNVAADDVMTLVTSRSTSSSTDNGTPPTFAYPLAVVTVADAAPSITNANIADKRLLASFAAPVVLPSQTETELNNTTDAAAGTITYDVTNAGPVFFDGTDWITL